MIGKTIKNVSGCCGESLILFTDGTIYKYEACQEYGDTYLYSEYVENPNDDILYELDIITAEEYRKRIEEKNKDRKIKEQQEIKKRELKELERLQKKYL